MKNLLITIIAILCSLEGRSQCGNDYTLVASSGTYTDLSGATTIGALTGIDDSYAEDYALGFTFTYFNTTFTHFSVSTDGFIMLTNNAGEMTSNDNSNDANNPDDEYLIAPLWDDLQAGTISYLLEGTTPNQTLTVQYDAMEWRYDNNTPTMDFQIVLHETTNKIDFIYNYIASDYLGSATIGLIGTGGVYNNLDGYGTSPSLTYSTEYNSIATGPADGQTYTFTPIAAPVASCASTGTTTGTDGITSVSFDDILNVTSTGDYNNYICSDSATVSKGSSYDLIVKGNTYSGGAYYYHGFAFFDWNDDGDFSDADESEDLGTIYNVSDGAFTTKSITIPASATGTRVRMRISVKYDVDPTSCESFTYGEVEDYMLVLESGTLTAEWDGDTSTDWNTASNWEGDSLPTSNTAVTIPSGTTYAPTISSSNDERIGDLTINSGATLTNSKSTQFLIIGGDFTNNGTYNQTGANYVKFTSSSGTISGTGNFYGGTICPFWIDDNANITFGALTSNAIRVTHLLINYTDGSNYGTVNLGANTVNTCFLLQEGYLNLNTGTLGIAGPTSYTMGSGTWNATTWANNGIDNPEITNAYLGEGTGTIIFNSGEFTNSDMFFTNNQTIPTATYYDLDVRNNNGYTVTSSGAVTVTNDLTLVNPSTSGGELQLGANLDVNNDIIVGAGCNIDMSTYDINLFGDLNLTGTFEVTGASGNAELFLDGTGTQNIDGFTAATGTVDINKASGTAYFDSDITVYEFQMSAGTLLIDGETVTVNTYLDLNGGTVQITSGLFHSTYDGDGTITNDGATLDIDGGEVRFGDLASDSNTGFQHNSGTIDISGGTFNIADDLNADGGTVTINGGTLNIAAYTGASAGGAVNKFDMSAGTLNLTSGTINIKGCYSSSYDGLDIASGVTVNANANHTINVQGNGTNDEDIYLDFNTNEIGDLTINLSGQTVYVRDAIDMKGDMTLTAGTFDIGTNSANVNLEGNWVNNTTFVDGTTTVTFDGTGTQTISGSTTPTMYNVTTASSGTTVASVVMNIDNDLTLGGTSVFDANAALDIAGAVTIASGTTFKEGANTHTVGGNWADSGTFTEEAGTIDFDASSGTQTISGSSVNFNNFTHSGAGTVSLSNNIDINGNYSQTAGTYTANATTMNVAGDWTDSGTFSEGTGTVEFDGSGTSTLTCSTTNGYGGGSATIFSNDCESTTDWNLTGGTSNWSLVTPDGVNEPATDNSASGTKAFFTAGNGSYVDDATYILTSPTIDLSGNTSCSLSFYLYLEGESTHDGGFIEVYNGSAWVDISGDKAYDGAVCSFNAFPSQNMWGVDVTTWTKVIVDISAYDGNSDFQIRFNFGTDNSATDGGMGIDDLEVTGSTSGTNITGEVFYNYITNKSSTGKITLANHIGVSNTPTLTDGYTELNAYNMYLADGSTFSGGSSSALIVTNSTGFIHIDDLATADGAVTFPVGATSSAYNPAYLTNVGTSDSYQVRIGSSVYEDGTSGNTYNDGVVPFTWYITESTAGGSDVTMKLEWSSSQEQTSFTRADAVIQHYSGGSWSNQGSGSYTDAGADPYSISVPSVTSFSPQKVAEIADQVLPVELISFEAECKSEGRVLTWVTGSELNNDYFQLDESINGQDFDELTTIGGNGTTSEIHDYQYVDFSKEDETKYYRLSQFDFDGESEVFNTIVSTCFEEDTANSDLSLSPSPLGGYIDLSTILEANVFYQVNIVDAGGKRIYFGEHFTTTDEVKDRVYIDASAKGIYIVTVTCNGKMLSGKLMWN